MVSPYHSLSPSPFQKSLTPPHPSNSPRSSGHLRLHCRPPQRRSPVGTPPLKLAFTTSPVLRHLVVSPPPTLPGALATRDQCLFRRPCTALAAGAPTASAPPRGDSARATLSAWAGQAACAAGPSQAYKAMGQIAAQYCGLLSIF
jgi:hypothetical protein